MASDIDGWEWLSIQMGDKSDNQPEGGRRLEDENTSDAHVRASAGESKSRGESAKKWETALHQKDGIMGSGVSVAKTAVSASRVSASGSVGAARARPAQGATAIDAVSSSLRTAYQSMINESVPDEMMDLLKKLG